MDKYEEEFKNLLNRIKQDNNGGCIPELIAQCVMQVCPNEAERVVKHMQYNIKQCTINNR